MATQPELERGVKLTHPSPWTPPYVATVITRDGTHLRVKVADGAAAQVREVALLCSVMDQLATVELDGDTLTKAWIE